MADEKHVNLEDENNITTDTHKFTCEVKGCGRSFKRSDHLRRHEKNVHGPRLDGDLSDLPLFSCEESDCEAVFRSRQSLNKHFRRSHMLNTYRCHHLNCGKVFRKHHQLRRHKDEEHNWENKYCCNAEGCDKVFPTPSKLKRHAKIHEGYLCKEPGCGSKFDKWTLLVKHNKIHHATAHPCSTCQKSFSNKSWLKQHMQTHEVERDVYICPHDNCGREYTNKRNLTSHVRSYHDQERFLCEQPDCGQTFTTKQKMLKHMKLHDPDRPLPKKKLKKKNKGLAEHLTDSRHEEDNPVLSSPGVEDRLEIHAVRSPCSNHVYVSHKSSEPDVIYQIQEELDSMKTILNRQKDKGSAECGASQLPGGGDQEEMTTSLSTEVMETV